MMAGMTSPDHAPHEPLPADVFARGCSSRGALQHLTGRWGALTIVALRLADEPMRFSEVRRRVDGISDRMLSQTLSDLERDGMVVRTVHSTIPPHVTYALAPLGLRVADPLQQLTAIIESELPSVLEARALYDESH